MREALRLARRGWGTTSPNPMVGAVLVKRGRVIGRGWHRAAGQPHAEIEALSDAAARGIAPAGATLYVTLEPCCTVGRTPACTGAIIQAGIRKVVVGATDPNPRHRGAGFDVLERAGIRVVKGVLEEECARLNEAFNHWIVHRTPFVIVKAAMTLDGRIATEKGESKWITGEQARRCGMHWRQGVDAILVGVNTVLADDPSLTWRSDRSGIRRPGLKDISGRNAESGGGKRLRRVVLDSEARTPLDAKVVSDAHAALTTIVVGESAPVRRVSALRSQVNVMTAPWEGGGGVRRIDIGWLLRRLGAENVVSLLVEGGGEVNASFLLPGFAHRVLFFYAPKILGGRASRPAVGGAGATDLANALDLREVEWRKIGEDLLLTALAGKAPVNSR
jgi:diaminohydroxyphosphoribosylaminopyrimidine deaminase/5-amino-6-(5-phosphoribosylamino)uracil reductase